MMADAPVTQITTARRTFVARLASIVAALPVVGRLRVSRAMAAVGRSGNVRPNATLLEALGDAVLPAEVGGGGITRAVSQFQRWMDEYRPGAEANHGYGTGRIEQLTTDPRPLWQAQLAALDADARRNGGQSFAALARDRRQSLVRSALAGERSNALPSPLAARHVALALLAHFYDSPAATDLCYDAHIGRQTCRPLGTQRQQPVAIERRAR